ncbi:hypothetical protein An01g06332 [Aspergillus niger]|uniref:Uncharacterized protein n=2 Tax=Aspergillus niger TaxID=5061 RepID=A2Q919_ASPNC|nr:hypothetical protein An01g06332 [Aspergillus niger]CAK43753.1 hypothetical protein An01g06332 [Aspergillus niger]
MPTANHSTAQSEQGCWTSTTSTTTYGMITWDTYSLGMRWMIPHQQYTAYFGISFRFQSKLCIDTFPIQS